MSINSTKYEMALDHLQRALQTLAPKGTLIIGDGMTVLLTNKNLYGSAAIAKQLAEAVKSIGDE